MQYHLHHETGKQRGRKTTRKGCSDSKEEVRICVVTLVAVLHRKPRQ